MTFPASDILIVDDNINNLQLLSGILAEDRLTIRRAINGAIALKSIQAIRPDLILLDILLPDYSGYQLCQLIKQNPATADIPIIFISALNTTLDKVKAFAVGGVDYISKPFEFAEVKARIHSQLQLRAATAEVEALNAALEARVEQRTAQLMAAKVTLEEQIKERHLAEVALQQSESRFRFLIENASDLIFLLDPQGVIRYASPAVDRGLGYNPSAFVGKPLTQWLHPQDHEKATQWLTEVFAYPDRVLTIILRCQHRQGNEPVFEAVAQRFADATSFAGVVVNARDVTECLRMEAVQSALEREKELSELKLRFFSMASHEFRTPLSVILMAAQILENAEPEGAQTKRLRNIKRIQSSAQSLKTMLSDVLEIARLEAQSMEFKPQWISLPEVCDRILETHQTLHSHEPRIHYTYSGSATTVYLDPDLLSSILSNLLTNALKYSQPHQLVQFQVDLTPAQVEFQIADQGIGIPPAHQEHLFEPFHRADNVGQIEGSGLGLAIVRKCVDLHNGTISLVSDPGGTTFIVQLPLQQPVQPPDPASNHAVILTGI
ncbi:MAG: response regulator [Acaryochloris sp. RU_4_1]|nr:response regulator [Acaryochloris sp. RU_4_1]